ncbi:MAG: radical SAM protein [Candidatus Bathyarchaeia archaeon]
MSLESFVINPSINVSPYCYSIFRIEPYLNCWHRCLYCFGRWYRGEPGNGSEVEPNVIRDFRRTLIFLRKRNLKIIPFRLSTLVDPFQPVEEKRQVSKQIMIMCLKYRIPLIINSKATLLLKDDLLNVLINLGSENLTIVQISLSTISAKIASVLEPNAPPPLERLNMAEKLSGKNIPVIIRLQPFIPGITDCEIEEIIREAHYAGVKQVIVEALRDEVENMRIYRELAYEKSIYDNLSSWILYSPSIEAPSKILRPSVEWRLKAYMRTKSLCEKYNIEFSTCKEGFYNYHTAKNCCGMHYLKDGSYLLRPTLHEVWMYRKEHGIIPRFEELVASLTDIYLFGDRIKRYPRALRKKVLSHEKILREILDEKRDIVKTLLVDPKLI